MINPDYKVPSRTNLALLVKTRYQDGKELGDLLQAAPGMALTTDAWMLRATQSLNTYTAKMTPSKAENQHGQRDTERTFREKIREENVDVETAV